MILKRCQSTYSYYILLLIILAFSSFLSAKEKYNILLITLDTVRADHLSYAGYNKITTPNIDQLAKKSIVFRNAYAPVPITLPAHVSILTGLYPQTHSVHDNSIFKLRNSVETMAELLKNYQYRTVAFVSSIILNHQYGLNQGFDLYDDNIKYDAYNNPIGERKAEQTTEAACKWIRKSEAPFFMWVHYFDPHFPYKPPKPFSEKYAPNLYDGEIAYVDNSIGSLLSCIYKKYKKSNLIILLVGDHGESLGEHGEDRHGILLYNSTLRVPFILHFPEQNHFVINHNVSLVDLLPTLLDYLKLPVPKYIEGKSLLPIIKNQNHLDKQRILFFETFMPYYTYRWSPLFAILIDNYKYIKAPLSELYDLEKDPLEASNILTKNEEFNYSKILENFFHKSLIYPWDIKQYFKDNEAATKEQLKSLGYLSSPPSKNPSPSSLKDPKSRISVLKKLDLAQSLLYQKIYNEAYAYLEEVIEKDSENGPALTMIAECLVAMERYDEALPIINKAIELYPENDSLYVYAGTIFKKKKNFYEAETFLKKALQINSMSVAAYSNLLHLYIVSEDMIKALEVAKEINNKKIEHPDIFFTIALMYIKMNKLPQAKEYLEKGLSLAPNTPNAIANLAKIYYLENNINKSIELYEKYLSLNPNDAAILSFLGSIYWIKLKNKPKALEYLQKAITIDPYNKNASQWQSLINKLKSMN